MSTDTTTPSPAADLAGPPWPTDHPGRKCSRCGLTAWSLWIDKTPPPGTCVDKAPDAASCPHNVDTAVSGMTFAMATRPERLPELREVLKGRGLDPALIEAFAHDWTEIDSDSIGLRFGMGMRVNGEELAGWLGTDPDRALVRATQIVKGIAWHLQIGIDPPEDGDLWRARFRRAWRHATRELLQASGDGPGGVDADDVGGLDNEGEG